MNFSLVLSLLFATSFSHATPLPNFEIGIIGATSLAKATVGEGGERRFKHWSGGEKRADLLISRSNFAYLIRQAEAFGTKDLIQAGRGCARNLIYLRFKTVTGQTRRFSACAQADTPLGRRLQAMLDRLSLLL